MTSKQYFKSAELVDLVHQNFQGFHPGYRGVHSSGRYYAAEFVATQEAAKLSRAIHFSGEPVPVSVRFSNSPSGYAFGPAASTSMAAKFYLKDGTVTDLIMLPLRLFVARNPDEVIELLNLLKPAENEAESGGKDPEKIKQHLRKFPWLGPAFKSAAELKASTSFAQTPYHALHAFRFINENNEVQHGRYHWHPALGESWQEFESLRKEHPNYLFEELEKRLQVSPVQFHLLIEIAEEGDDLNDPSAPWPENRQHIKAGTLNIYRPTSAEEIGDAQLMHDPTRITDGIELTDDPIIAARRGVYELSLAQRTGGWRGKQHSLDIGKCPFLGNHSSV